MRLWIVLALVYAVFLYWYGGYGTPLSEVEVAALAAQLERVDPSSEVAPRLLEFARNDDGREFFMVNLNRYRQQPRYADGRSTDGLSAEEVDRRYTSKMIPRLLSRACHPWALVLPLANFGEEVPDFDRLTLVRYRSRRDFLEIVITDQWREDAEHKWAALEWTHSFPARPALTLLGPRAAVFGLLVALGLALRARASRFRQAAAHST